VRIAALEAGLREIDRLGGRTEDDEQREVLDRLRDEYVHRIEHLRGHGGETPESVFDHAAQLASVRAEREEIMRLRDRGDIPDEIFRRVLYDLDLAEARLF
jgi:hypothetical protein